MRRIRIHIRGAVQGVGFRPFVYRVAKDEGLTGWVTNTAEGVVVELQGVYLERALDRLASEAPHAASISGVESEEIPVEKGQGFEIRSSHAGTGTTRVSPDLATCDACLNDIRDPVNRRFNYAFTNCTDCGPRFSIVRSIPYDRPNTTMSIFDMCSQCMGEYEDPMDRRFHAQPNCCPECGPRLVFCGEDGKVVDGDPLSLAREAIAAGAILAAKGLGGFHLVCDARNTDAVENLRARKRRPHKPFAVMFRSLEAIEKVASLSAAERRALQSAAAPIVLIDGQCGLAPGVSPVGHRTGAFLAHTPLHHLLLAETDAIVATSANTSGEPLCIETDELFERFAGVFDAVLTHDRPIARPVEDSVVEVFRGQTLFHRFGRGFAPGCVARGAYSAGVLGVGGHLKATVAVSVHGEIWLGAQIGDLDSEATRERYREGLDDLVSLARVDVRDVRCDKHPDYYSTRMAESRWAVQPVQHHMAHVLAVMAEHELQSAFGVAWDGVGYGEDGTAWGGEFLVIDEDACFRTHIEPYLVAPGEQTARRPWRSATSVTRILGVDWRHGHGQSAEEVDALWSYTKAAGQRTTSVGRLFDAMASILGLVHESSFEAHAAQALQSLAETVSLDEQFSAPSGDWRSVMTWALDAPDDAHAAWRFHRGLASLIVAEAIVGALGRPVVLSGGCFQNRLLLSMAVQGLEDAGFDVFWSTRFPAGDGGLAVGQVAAR